MTKNISLKLSNEAKDLVMKMLDKNQKSRIKMCQIKTHPFFDKFSFSDIYEMKVSPPFNIDAV